MVNVYYQDEQVAVHSGDCLDVLADIADASIDAICTDPPYGLEFMGAAWDSFKVGRSAQYAKGGDLNTEAIKARSGRGGAGPVYVSRPAKRCTKCGKQAWSGSPCVCAEPDWIIDNSPLLAYQAWCQAWAAECLRVLKPGGHMLAFGGSRTHHRMICAIEDAGFEIRDAIAWLMGSGFPKSLNVTEALARIVPPDVRCVCGQHSTQTVPSSQSDYPSNRDSDDERLPLASDTAQDAAPSLSGALAHSPYGQREDGQAAAPANTFLDAANGHHATGYSQSHIEHQPIAGHSGASGPSDTQTNTSPDTYSANHKIGHHTLHTSGSAAGSASSSPLRNQYMSCPECGKVVIPQGLGTALKPAMEIICVARKPIQGTVAGNVLKHGTGALNVDGCRVEGGPRPHIEGARSAGRDDVRGFKRGSRHLGTTTAGRWPPNVVLDNEMADELDKQSGSGTSRYFPVFNKEDVCGGASTKAESTSAGRNLESSDDNSHTDGYGNRPTDQSPLDTRSTTETTTRLTTPSTTSCVSPRNGTTTTTSDYGNTTARSTELNSDAASGAANGKPPPATQSAAQAPTTDTAGTAPRHIDASGLHETARRSTPSVAPSAPPVSTGSLPVFKYTPKAATTERPTVDGISHPTVKPLELMRWLIRLVTPPHGLVLDPFAGTGTVGEAAIHEHMRAVLIEREPDYLPLIVARLSKPMEVGFDFDGASA
jgi:DNA modification methylase